MKKEKSRTVGQPGCVPGPGSAGDQSYPEQVIPGSRGSEPFREIFRDQFPEEPALPDRR